MHWCSKELYGGLWSSPMEVFTPGAERGTTTREGPLTSTDVSAQGPGLHTSRRDSSTAVGTIDRNRGSSVSAFLSLGSSGWEPAALLQYAIVGPPSVDWKSPKRIKVRRTM
ncbi:hypothetical protein SKAU_G00147240 [Synaphobranchus kaupii]|uniref:Uncharacterized protein n=1 Tax=Synaphobranchus kaupii TaxID=118154 RepID=A0A9Q1FTP7_SYNKA|nr:hypothetical protein SKAU_G00147240 [Synaphobranchus kaupii]